MDTNAIGRFIAEPRKQKGYTQKDLAEIFRLDICENGESRFRPYWNCTAALSPFFSS